MGQKELLRSKMLEMVKQKQMTLKAAAITLKVSYRQGKRLYAAYLKKGDAGLVHGNCGRKSNNRLEEALREKAVRAYQERHSDFGPTFAAEKMGEAEGMAISVSSLRRMLIEAGEWKKKKRGKEYRSPGGSGRDVLGS